MSANDNMELARYHVEELWNKHNFDVVDEIYTDDFVIRSLWLNPLLPGGQGDRAGAKTAAQAWAATFPDMKFTFEHVVADDEGKVVTVHTCSGTDTVGVLGRPPTGKHASITGILIHQMRDGKISNLWTMFDLWAVMVQLGHIPMGPPPGAGGPPPGA
jgi:steroid delta-isomerase-like uncharacterized protein